MRDRLSSLRSLSGQHGALESRNSFDRDSFNRDSFNRDSYSRDSFNGDSHNRDSFNGDSHNRDSFSGDSYSRDSFNLHSRDSRRESHSTDSRRDSHSTDSHSTDWRRDSYSRDSHSTDSRRDSHGRDSRRDSHSRDSHGRHSFRESVSSESFSHLTLGEEEEEDDGEEEEEEEERREERSGNTEEVEQVLQEAQEVRREIQLLKLDVKRLRDQNARLLSNPCATSEGHQDANAIGQEIKTRGEEVLGRLRQMDERSRRREEELGVNAVAARIGRTQYVCLSNGFRDAMRDYQQAETSHREACSNHIRRQMEIVGRDLSSEQLDDMMESGQWNVFADNLLTEGKTARTALNQIERRHQDLLDLERRIRSVHEVFLDVAMLLEEQGAMATSIQLTVEQTEVATGDAVAKIESAKKYDRKNPLKKLMFWRR